MTLLILPLMESVAEAATESLGAGEWVLEHEGQLLSFVISFMLVASFWRGHHALFEHLERYTPWLMLLNFGWLFTIVALPVATAISNSLTADRSSIVVYVGTMMGTAAFSCGMQVQAMRHPELWREDYPVTTRGLATTLALLIGFAVALTLALLLPAVNYYSMFVLFLTAPLARLIDGRLRWTPPAAPAGSDHDR